MSEPHKIVQKEVFWDEFVSLLFGVTVIEYESYCFAINRVRLEDNKIVIYNGSSIWSLLSKEDNEIIKYGLGSFYFNTREYDQEESEETSYDGYPILKDLETYKLVEKQIKLHELKII
jgi:hypothetical protein